MVILVKLNPRKSNPGKVVNNPRITDYNMLLIKKIYLNKLKKLTSNSKMQNNGSAPGGSRHRRLVLHFDINNTILMKDTAKGIHSV